MIPSDLPCEVHASILEFLCLQDFLCLNHALTHSRHEDPFPVSPRCDAIMWRDAIRVAAAEHLFHRRHGFAVVITRAAFRCRGQRATWHRPSVRHDLAAILAFAPSSISDASCDIAHKHRLLHRDMTRVVREKLRRRRREEYNRRRVAQLRHRQLLLCKMIRVISCTQEWCDAVRESQALLAFVEKIKRITSTMHPSVSTTIQALCDSTYCSDAMAVERGGRAMAALRWMVQNMVCEKRWNGKRVACIVRA